MNDKKKKPVPRPRSVKKQLALPPDEGISLEADDVQSEAGIDMAGIDMIEDGDDPYEHEPEERHRWFDLDPEQSAGHQQPFEVTPHRILEAMLFVGVGTKSVGRKGVGTKSAGKEIAKQNEESDTAKSGSPEVDDGYLDAKSVARLMRGVRADEIQDFVAELNAEYERDNCPYRIVSAAAGFRMQFSDQFKHIQNRFYGQIKEAELPQPVVDVLSLVAYRQPVTKDVITELRGRQSGSILSQLVRRGLLKVERTDDKPRKTLYRTTDRFLEMFGLSTLEDLPSSGHVEFSD